MNEISSAFVRIRPAFGNFQSEVITKIKGTLREIQGEVSQTAARNNASTATEVRANEALLGSYKTILAQSKLAVGQAVDGIGVNKMLAASYTQLAATAKAGSVEQLSYQKLAREAAVSGAATVKEAAAAKAAIVRAEIGENRALATSYSELALAAKAGSAERLTYEKLAREAAIAGSATIKESAAANVAATEAEITANRELAASYQLIASSAARGSAERIAAARLAASAAAAGGLPAAVRGGAVGAAAARVRGAGAGLGGKALVGGIGAAIGAHFIKELVDEAAAVEKFKETVASQFGAAGKAIVKFANGDAAKLGIIDDTVYETSSRFGILFKNLGVGQKAAAQMTIGWEKLGGALSAIRGKDPKDVMQGIVLAAAGNTRGLKQLGIAVDQTQIKNEALRLGLIATTKGALTPGIKAQAIYSLATRNLSGYLSEAQKHSGDYANVQRRLAVAWDNATDVIGEGLLPSVTRLAEFLSRNMPTAIKYVQRGFGDLRDTVKQLVDFVRPGFEAIRGNATAMKIAIGGITIALGLLVAAAFPITSIVLAVVGLGIAFQEAYRRSARFREIVHQIGEAIKGLKPTFEAVVATITEIWNRWGETIKRVAMANIHAVIGIIRGELQVLKGVFQVIGGILTLDWHKTWTGIKNIVLGTGTSIKAGLVGLGRSIVAIFDGIWENVKESVIRLELWIVKQFARIPTSISIFGHKIGFTNPFKGLQKGLEDSLSDIHRLSGKAEETLKAQRNEPRVSKAAKDVGKNIGDNIAAGAAVALGTTPVLSAAEIKAMRAANDKIAAARKALAAAQAAGAEQVMSAQKRLQEFITSSNAKIAEQTRTGNEKIVKSARDAATNLVSIGQKLSASIGKFLDTGPTTKGLENTVLGKQLKALKESLSQGAGGHEVLQRAQLLSSQLRAQQGGTDDVTKKKAAVSRRVNDLTDELNKHLITWKAFQAKLHSYLGSQGITYKKIYGALGRSAADSFQDQLKGLGLQAKAIATESPKVRGLLGKAGAQGSSPIKVIDPNAVAVRVQAQLTAAHTRQQLGITQRQHALDRAEARAASRSQAARDRVAHATQARQLAIANRTLAATKKIEQHTAAAAKAARATPPRSGSQKSTSPPGPHGPVGVNPGHTAAGARYGAAAQLGLGG